MSIFSVCGGTLVGALLLRLGRWLPLTVATLVVAGLAWYLYLGERRPALP
jgi:hypothetical protein